MLTVIPAPTAASVMYRKPPTVGGQLSVEPSHVRTASEKYATPQSTVKPGNRYATRIPKLATEISFTDTENRNQGRAVKDADSPVVQQGREWKSRHHHSARQGACAMP